MYILAAAIAGFDQHATEWCERGLHWRSPRMNGFIRTAGGECSVYMRSGGRGSRMGGAASRIEAKASSRYAQKNSKVQKIWTSALPTPAPIFFHLCILSWGFWYIAFRSQLTFRSNHGPRFGWVLSHAMRAEAGPQPTPSYYLCSPTRHSRPDSE